ncbi:MAG: O-antigen ligase family protein [Chthoniobacter sp.]|nr:O-antigen ligase family protein [Chthoniobacter sp.]
MPTTTPMANRAALWIFSVIVAAGPLLFGAVDRPVQVALVLLLAAGVALRPPAIVPLSRWGNRLVIVLLVLLVGKELAPAEWFGPTLWRKMVTQDLGIELPATHHPEPARALDSWLAAIVAAIWFLWVRRLAAERENRAFLTWSLFGAAALVALVSFATRGWDPQAIYGLRYTVGWRGFGPFPNRNHTGDFFAMGALLGGGCVGWAAARRDWRGVAGAVALLGLVLAALLVTESRGGLIAFGLGLVVFLALVQIRLRSRQALVVAAGVALLVVAFGLAFGGPVLARFQSEQAGIVSNSMRLNIWRDVFSMWKDAPLLGHGVDSFQQIFPFYQTFEFENGVVLHPESSWRQWLVELGLIPVVVAALALGLFLATHLRETLTGRSFFFRAAGFSAVIGILGHSVFDVPSHRWGTAGFALAALALACPMRLEGRRIFSPRKAALVPLVVAAFWVLPFFGDVPAWSPLSLNRVLARNALSLDVSLQQLDEMARYFPLSSDLNQHLGMRELAVLGRSKPTAWQRHFSLASQLLPGSWRLPETQARAVANFSPGLALGYWQQAVGRGAAHRADVLIMAVNETLASPMAAESWSRYVEANPRLLLAYAQLVPSERAQSFAAQWWQARALTADLDPGEISAFYQNANRWITREQFEEWMQSRAAWRARDRTEWARLLHAWGDDRAAWPLLAETAPEENFPSLPSGLVRESLEQRWRIAPGNFVNAQHLAAILARDGDVAQSEEIILAVGASDGAPWWFVHKAAHILARRAHLAEAVGLLLKSQPPRTGGT